MDMHNILNQAYQTVQIIEVNRSCGASTHRRRSNSSLNTNGQYLFKELIDFIGRCQSLQILTFHLVKIRVAAMAALGNALVRSRSGG
jgi:hypothetical protein